MSHLSPEGRGRPAKRSEDGRVRGLSTRSDSRRGPSPAAHLTMRVDLSPAGRGEVSVVALWCKSMFYVAGCSAPGAISMVALSPPRVPVCQIAALRSIHRIAALNAIAIASTSKTPAKTCGLSRMVR
jgi:hypothetical protein